MYVAWFDRVRVISAQIKAEICHSVVSGNLAFGSLD